MRMTLRFVYYIVACFATEDAVRIVNSFYYSFTRCDNYFLHFCAFTQLIDITRQYSQSVSHSLHHTLYIFTGRPLVFFCRPGSTVDLFRASGIHLETSKLPTVDSWVAPVVFKIIPEHGPQRNTSSHIVAWEISYRDVYRRRSQREGM
jgi:hypothetical protein